MGYPAEDYVKNKSSKISCYCPLKAHSEAKEAQFGALEATYTSEAKRLTLDPFELTM